MKLTEIHLIQEASNTREFVFPKWDGNEPSDVTIDPFDVTVTYHAEAGGSSKHPYGEGTAEERHPDVIEVLSLTTAELVHAVSDHGEHLDKVVGMDVNVLITGQKGAGVFHRVEKLFPNAVVLKGDAIQRDVKSRGALNAARIVFEFLEEHKTSDIIIDVDTSQILSEPHTVAIIKAAMDDGELSWKQVGKSIEFNFSGRIIIVATGDVKMDAGIRHRAIQVDMSKDKTYPIGTDVTEIPGWEESSWAFFEQKAADDFNGGQ